MNTYVLRRLLLAVPTVIGVAIVAFVLMRLLPGDVADLMREDGRYWSPEFSEQIRQSLGLDKSIPEQFVIWTAGAVRGDFGTSYWQKKPVSEILWVRLARSVELALLAFGIALLVGISAGALAAVKQDTWADYAVRVFSIGGLSLPSFFTAIVLLYVLLTVVHWIPPLRYVDLAENPVQNLSQLIWPAMILGYATSAPIARMMRSQLLEVIRQDYILTARAKGLAQATVVVRHALKNGLLPVVTIAGIQIGTLLGGTVILERIFGIPGMGSGIVEAVQWRDYPLVQAFLMCISLVFVASNLLVDILYGWLDPRIRYH